MIRMNRRSLITGLISLVAAPAIVRATSIMPVRAMLPLVPEGFAYLGLDFYVCTAIHTEFKDGQVTVKREWTGHQHDRGGSVIIVSSYDAEVDYASGYALGAVVQFP